MMVMMMEMMVMLIDDDNDGDDVDGVSVLVDFRAEVSQPSER